MLPGFLVLDKPAGRTSHDLVGIVRSITGIKRVGHTGTLDPFATGVLPLALGAATRFIQFLDEGEKVYEATLRFGQDTDTLDLEGQVVREAGPPRLELLEQVLASFTGSLMQRPPAYSAVKIDGKPLYAYARKGEVVVAEPRPVQVQGIEVLASDPRQLRFRCRVSRGTYVRVLAQEIAEALGSAGHLVQLRRLRSGPFSIEAALSMDQLAVLACGQPDWQLAFARERDRRPERVPQEQVRAGLEAHLVSLGRATAHYPTVGTERPELVLHGRMPTVDLPEGTRFRVLDGQRLLAIAEVREGRSKALRVLASA